MSTRSFGRGLIVAFVLFVGAACGDDDSGSGNALDLGAVLTTSSTTTSSTTTSSTSSTVAPGGLFDDTGTGAPGSGLFGTDEHDFEPSGTTPEAPSGASSEVTAFYGTDLINVDLAVALYEACAGGDMQACDGMYLDAAGDSEAEAFGATCAGELPSADQYCADIGGSATGTHAPLAGIFTGSAQEGNEAALVNACERGSMNACDALYDLNLGADSRAYGATCGARVDTDQYCSNLYGLGYDWAVAWRDMVGI